MEYKLLLICVLLVLLKLTEGSTSSKVIPSTKRISQQNCPVYTVNTQACVNLGGVPTMTTDSLGCKKPACVYQKTTTKAVTTSSGITTTTSKTKTIPTKTIPVRCPVYTVNTQICVDQGGVPTWYTGSDGCKRPSCDYPQTTSVTTTTTKTKTIPTTRRNCPVYTVNTQICVDQGGIPTWHTDSDGCKSPSCDYPKTTTTKTVTTSKVVTTTTSTKTIPTTRKTKRCPTFTIYTKPCVDKGGHYVFNVDSDGCTRHSCVYPETTSETKTTSTKTISTKRIPPQNCPVYTVNTQSCINKGGVPTMTTDSLGCNKPTCEYPQTTSTKTVPTTKTIPSTTTTTTTKTIPSPSDCGVVTVTKKEKVTVTVKETITVTQGNGSKPTDSPTGQCAKKWAQCGGIGYNGPTCCEAGSTCHELGKYYSQCM